MRIASSKIQLCRVKKGLSLRDLAEISGVSIAAISAIERGPSNPHPKTTFKLCEALGLDFEDAFVLDDAQHHQEG